MHDLNEQLNKLLDSYKKDSKIEMTVKDKVEFINLIYVLSAKVLVNLLEEDIYILKGLNALGEKVHRPSDIEQFGVIGPEVIRVEIDLLDFMYYKVKEVSSKYALGIVVICYWILFEMAARRLLLYVGSYGRDPLYYYSGDVLQQDPLSKPYLDKAIENLTNFASNIYKDKTGQEEIRDKNQIISDLGIAITKAFRDDEKDTPLDLKEALIRTAEGDDNIRHVPYAAATHSFDVYRKHKNEDFWEDIKSNLPENLRSIESIPDIPKLREVEKASDLAMWIESIKDPIDREIAQLIFANGLTVRKIAEGLSLSKSDVDRRIQKLKKNKPTF